ncbi:MAG TPA: MXAN_5187 C-terminal domain-containing protein [Vicinamibacterales bacterium]
MADFVKPKSEFEKEMLMLEAEIRRLEAEFNMFFAGRLPRPPWETRARVTALVKKIDNSFIRNTADRFRFESLQNRFQKFIELWERQMTNRELGRPVMGARKPEPPPAPKKEPEKTDQPEAAASAQQAEARPLVPPREKVEGVDPSLIRFAKDQALSKDSDAVRKLHEQLSNAKKQAGETPVPIDRLAALVKAQVDKFKKEGRDVDFKVGMKDGKVQLTVTPVKDD